VIRPSTRPPQARLEPWKGSWVAVDTAYVGATPRTGAIVRVDDLQVFEAAIWGGTGPDGEPLLDGVLFDSASEDWIPMLPAPMCPRTGYAVDQGQILVYGGQDGDGRWLDDGALYARARGDGRCCHRADPAPGQPATARPANRLRRDR
jgi:hypothetical protein